jgi:hypothetical protein
MERTLDFEYERETKNKYRYREAGDEPVMGTVYVSKGLFDDRPERLRVTLMTVDG